MCGRFWIFSHLVSATPVLVVFVGAIGNLFGLRISCRLIHECMNSVNIDSVVSAETETEVESTSAISSEVHSHSQHLQKELV